MSAQSIWPIVLFSQNSSAGIVPPALPGGAQSDRLRAAMRWSFAFTMQQYEQPQYFLLRISDGGQQSGTEAPRLLSEITAQLQYDGDQVHLQLHRRAGDWSLADLEVLPLDLAHQPIEFVRIDDDADRGSLRYVSDQGHGVFTVRLHAIKAPQVPAARACVATEVNGTPICFADPLWVLLDRPDDIRIDQLHGPESRLQPLAMHLRELFWIVFENMAECTISIACLFETSQPLPFSVPVLLSPSIAYAADRLQALTDTLAQAVLDWQKSARVEKGDLVFDLSVFSDHNQQRTPCLRLRQLRLPIGSVADMQTAGQR